MTDNAKLRAWWFHRQGLDGTWQGAAPREVLLRSGWARSVGGVGPYLTLTARAGCRRDECDRAVRELEIHELPAARGCTYVVPADDYALALKVGQEFGEAPLRTASKLGVTAQEIDHLCEAVAQALVGKTLDPEQIREATGDASRSLGEAGKKKGLTTTLPLVLGRLQSEGIIRRVPKNGRLDQQRYSYALWKPNPLAKCRWSASQAYAELARRYFDWIGPATIAEFQWFSGLGVKAAQAALASLKLVPVSEGSNRLMPAENRAEFEKFRPPSEPCYRLVSSLDAIHAHRRDVSALVDLTDSHQELLNDPGKPSGGALSDLPCHAILDRGRLIGLWEFDFDKQTIAWTAFVKKDKRLQQAVAECEAYIRNELGDARSFSLDSPKSRAPRIAALRGAGE
ncbi:MAG: DNA glycosylase AlkZ-like family protein [Planctomycetales bacterium]